MKKLTKGFTLIELLVVIAIIGILSSVVLASLNTARSKGSDAAVKSNLANMRAQAELLYDGDYDAVCSGDDVTSNNTTIQSALDSAADAGSDEVSCILSVGGGWAISASLPSNPTPGYWCVDSSGYSGTVAAIDDDGECE